MAAVQMPDGSVVDMPDQMDPALGARLRAFQQNYGTSKSTATPATNPSVGGKETTEGPLGFANGIAELVGKGLGNVPMAAVHALTQLVTGHGTDASKPPTFPLSPNAQSVGQGISDTLGQAAAPYQNPVVDAAANSNISKNYVAPVLSKVAAATPMLGPASRVLGPLSDAIGPMGTAASEAAGAAQAASPAGQLAAKGWQMRPSDVAKLTPGGQPTMGGGALQSIVGDRAAAQALGPQNALLAQQKAASGAGIPLTPHGLIDDAALEKAKAPHAAVYEQMANVPGEATPSTYTEAIQKLHADPTLAPETQAAVDKLVDLHSDVGNSASASQSIKTLRQKGSNLIGNDNPDLQDRGYAMKGISRALEDVLEQRAVEAGQPELASQFQQARKGYAQIMAVQDASKAGMIDPQALLKARNKGAPLSGDLADVADAAEALPDVVKHQHAFSGGAASLPTTAVGALQGIARNLGGEALLKGPYQRALRGTSAEGLGAEFGPDEPPSGGGISSSPIAEPKLGDTMSGQRGGPPSVDMNTFNALRQLQNTPRTYGGSGLTDMSLPPEQRALERERAAALRDQQEGVSQQFTPEPVPLNAAMREGETARRTSEPLSDVFANRGSNDVGSMAGGASPEAMNRQKRSIIHWNGDTAKVVASDVNQIDKITPPHGSIAIDPTTNELVSSGTTPRNLVEGLLNRWKASLGGSQ